MKHLLDKPISHPKWLVVILLAFMPLVMPTPTQAGTQDDSYNFSSIVNGTSTSTSGSSTVIASGSLNGNIVISSTNVVTARQGVLEINDGSTLNLSGTIAINQTNTSQDRSTYAEALVVSSGSANLSGNISIQNTSFAGSAIELTGTDSYVSLSATESGQTITIVDNDPSGGAEASQYTEAADIYVSSGSMDVNGNINMISNQWRGYGIWLGGTSSNLTVNGSTYIETRGNESFGIRLDGGNLQFNGDLTIATGTHPYPDANGNTDANGSAGVRAITGWMGVTGQTNITTYGGVAEVGSSNYTEESSYGIWNTSASRMSGNGAVMCFHGANITTYGDAAHGIYNDSNAGSIVFHGDVNIETHGSAGTVTWDYTPGSDSAAINENVGAYGVDSALSGTTIFKNDLTTINTYGDYSGGMRSTGGFIEERGNVAITTRGVQAYGIVASSSTDNNSNQYQGIVQVDGMASITTSGSGADAVYTSGSGQVSLNGGLAVNVLGENAYAINAYGQSAVNVSGQVIGTGNIKASDQAKVNITMQGNSNYGGDITTDGSATVDLNVAGNARYSGAANVSGASDQINVSLSGQSVWDITDNSTVSTLSMKGGASISFNDSDGQYKTLTVNNLTNTVSGLSASNDSVDGAFQMNANIASNQSDHLNISGASSGNYTVIIKNSGDYDPYKSAAVPSMITTSKGSTASFQGSLDCGMYTYALGSTTNSDGSTNWNLASNGQRSATGQAVLGVVSTQMTSWLSELDTLSKRFGDLRLMSTSGEVHGGAWIRSYGSELNVGGDVSGQSFDAYLYGVDFGVDKAWKIDKDNHLITGIFAGYGVTDQDYNHIDSTGESDDYYAGVYGTWFNSDGWYADFVGKFGYFNNSFDVTDNSFNTTRGSYHNWAAGVSIEAGKQFLFKNGWFVEPEAQVAYVHDFSSNYDTSGANIMRVDQGDGDTIQVRGGMSFGRNIRLSKHSILQPYIKVDGVEQVSSGGYVDSCGESYRPDLDGARAEISVGTAWQLNDNSQLHIEYQAVFASQYDQPWGLDAGYRVQF